MSVDRHGPWVALVETILVINNWRAFSRLDELLRVRIFLFEIVSPMYFLYYLLVLVFYFFDLFLQIFKLLMQVCYLLSSPRVPLVINPSRRSQIGLIANWMKFIAFSKSLAHLKWILLLIGNIIKFSRVNHSRNFKFPKKFEIKWIQKLIWREH